MIVDETQVVSDSPLTCGQRAMEITIPSTNKPKFKQSKQVNNNNNNNRGNICAGHQFYNPFTWNHNE
jgi:hypothetical protein